jgi:hypothetical protein
MKRPYRGVHHFVDTAEEEEFKEAVLAYHKDDQPAG